VDTRIILNWILEKLVVIMTFGMKKRSGYEDNIKRDYRGIGCDYDSECVPVANFYLSCYVVASST